MWHLSLATLLLLPLGLVLLACLILAVLLLQIHSAFRHYHTDGYSHFATRAASNGRAAAA